MPKRISDELFCQLSNAITRTQTRIDGLEEEIATEHMKIRSRSSIALGIMPHGERVPAEIKLAAIIRDVESMRKIGDLSGKIVVAEKLKENMQVSKVRTGLLIIFRNSPDLLKNQDILDMIANSK